MHNQITGFVPAYRRAFCGALQHHKLTEHAHIQGHGGQVIILILKLASWKGMIVEPALGFNRIGALIYAVVNGWQFCTYPQLSYNGLQTC